MRVSNLINRFGSAASLAIPISAIVGFLCPVSVVAAPVNLLTNGSFEEHAFFIERSGFPRLDDINGSAPTGWTRDSGTLAEYLTRAPAYLGLTIYNPSDGDFFIGPHDGEWWEQTFATSAGTSYKLSYSVANGSAWWTSFYYRPAAAPGNVTVTGGALLLSADLSGPALAPTGTTLLDAPFVWSRQTLTFVADSDSTTLRFSGPSLSSGGYIFVDNAWVTAVPEPQSLVMLLLGLSALCLACRVTNRNG